MGKPSAAYVKDGRLYVPTPVTLTNVGMTPPNRLGMGFDCDTDSGSGKITTESDGERPDGPTISPLVIQGVIYPNDPYEIVPAFSVPLDKIGAGQREGFFITATFHIHYFWAGGRGQVGLNGIIRPAGRGPTKFKLDDFSENRSVSTVFMVLDTFAS